MAAVKYKLSEYFLIPSFYSPSEELPKKADSITPYTMALISKYIARHRLRETRLLDTIADFLVKKGEYLDSKVSKVRFSFLLFVFCKSHI